MRRLLDFLVRHRLLLLFLLLQSVSLLLTIRQRPFQRARYWGMSAEMSGFLYEKRTHILDFFSLREQNRQLGEENARLQSLLKEHYFELYSSREEQVDTLLLRKYVFTAAQVINSSFTRRDNLLTLNKGSVHGLEPGMGVISADGIVGAIKACSRHYSTVIPLLHSRFSTSGTIGRTQYFGTLRWDANDYRFAQLEDIPVQAPVAKGDTIFSTSISGIFPPHVAIGLVESVEAGGDALFKQAQIRLSVDFSRLNHVQVVEHFLLAERDSLELYSQQP